MPGNRCQVGFSVKHSPLRPPFTAKRKFSPAWRLLAFYPGLCLAFPSAEPTAAVGVILAELLQWAGQVQGEVSLY